MNLHLRLDCVKGHITQTMFLDGANAGKLVMAPGEYQVFGAALLLAAKHMPAHLTVKIDPIGWTADGRFTMPDSQDCETVQDFRKR